VCSRAATPAFHLGRLALPGTLATQVHLSRPDAVASVLASKVASAQAG
jgi:hypothetical protein